MNSRDIARLRLINQRLAGTEFTTPCQLVKWMGCIQAQDFGMAKWAVGCRLQQATDPDIEKEFNEGRILRTHVLRPTWHFVCPEDIRWMLKLSAVKIKALTRPYHQQLGIDYAILRKSKQIITQALDQHHKLTRPQLTAILQKAGIDTSDARVGHLLMDAELDALICSAGRIGKQFAYGLLDSTKSDLFGREEAIAELARRYFLSRGPATVQDFAWWGGLTLTEARKGLDAIRRDLETVSLDGNEYWFARGTSLDAAASSGAWSGRPEVPSTFLLPAFDEYTVAYKDRDHVLDPAFASACFYGLKPIVVHNTRIVGTWQRTEKKDNVLVETTPFSAPPPDRALAKAINKYAAFTGKARIK
jgi:hypothetical protein